MRMYTELTQNGKISEKIAQQQKVVDFANRKKNKLLQLVAEDSITSADFKQMTADCNKEIQNAEAEIAELEQLASEGDEFKRKIDEMRKVLARAQAEASQGIVTKEFIDKYISKIFVTPEDENTMMLQIKIFTGETTEKYLRKLEGRAGNITTDMTEHGKSAENTMDSGTPDSMGHTFKKMIEAYENGMK